MLNNIRKFSKTVFAKIILVIIIIPFVFWGMGGVFNTGNTNNIVKIDNQNISTQDFMDHLNDMRLDPDTIRDNIDNNLIEEILAGLISKVLLDMEIKNLDLQLSEKNLGRTIKNNKNFLDDDKKFSRVKYEKFLILNNIDAPSFEKRVYENELKKRLFNYISGGIKSPLFLTNQIFEEETKNIDVEVLALNGIYKSKKSFTKAEIVKFIDENKEILEVDYIDFSYVKLNPKNLTGSNEFSDLFFNKVDEIENKILNEESFESIVSQYKLKALSKKDYTHNSGDDIDKSIYSKRNETKTQLIDKDDFYLMYEIKSIKKVLPEINNNNFKNKVVNLIYEKNKYDFNKKLIEDINSKIFDNNSFIKLSNNKSTPIKKIKISSIQDDKTLTSDSIKLLYSLPINSFTLVTDDKNNIYLAKILKQYTSNIKKSSDEYNKYFIKSNVKIKENIYSSYDVLINGKYKVKINEKTIERVKNYFR